MLYVYYIVFKISRINKNKEFMKQIFLLLDLKIEMKFSGKKKIKYNTNLNGIEIRYLESGEK